MKRNISDDLPLILYKSGYFLDEDPRGRTHFSKSFDHMLESNFEEFSCRPIRMLTV
jgi:hypothetical protein